jgi:hypothetical protein
MKNLKFKKFKATGATGSDFENICNEYWYTSGIVTIITV